MRTRNDTTLSGASGEFHNRTIREVRRSAQRVRIISAWLREDHEETWQFDEPKWDLVYELWDLLVLPNSAIEYSRSADAPGEKEWTSAMQYDELAGKKAGRFDLPGHDDAAQLCGYVPGTYITVADLIESARDVRLHNEKKEIHGESCRSISVDHPSGSYTLWMDDAKPACVRRIDVIRKASDEFYGCPLWRALLTAEELEQHAQPDEADLQVQQCMSAAFSDFRELGDKAELPWRVTISTETVDRDGQVFRKDRVIEMVSVQQLERPLRLESLDLRMREGTPVNRNPPDDRRREWRGGRVVVIEAPGATTRAQK